MLVIILEVTHEISGRYLPLSWVQIGPQLYIIPVTVATLSVLHA